MVLGAMVTLLVLIICLVLIVGALVLDAVLLITLALGIPVWILSKIFKKKQL